MNLDGQVPALDKDLTFDNVIQSKLGTLLQMCRNKRLYNIMKLFRELLKMRRS